MGFEALILPPEMARMAAAGTWKQLTSEELAQAQVDTYNQTRGSLSGGDCLDCLNKGNIMYLRENSTRNLRECTCMPRRRSLARLARSGLTEMLEAYTFSTFQTPQEWQRRAKDKARAFLTDNCGKWLVAAGAVGSGKSHLCTAVCGALISAGFETRYMLWREVGGRIKAAVNDTEVYNQLLKPLKTVKVLYIDDFFKGSVTEGDKNLAFELLNSRYNSRSLITVISTEKTVEEILALDEAVGSRIYECSKDYYLRITGSGKNWRLRHEHG